MNVLLGMVSGKVVIGEFEVEVEEMYGINYIPMINCKPDIDRIVSSIEILIVNQYHILNILNNSKKYITRFS